MNKLKTDKNKLSDLLSKLIEESTTREYEIEYNTFSMFSLTDSKANYTINFKEDSKKYISIDIYFTNHEDFFIKKIIITAPLEFQDITIIEIEEGDTLNTVFDVVKEDIEIKQRLLFKK